MQTKNNAKPFKKTPDNAGEFSFYQSPFSSLFWKNAAGELKKPRVLVFAALIIALRVAVKAISIPVGPSLHISIDFFVNSLGSMIYGPVVGLLVGAVSDTIGALLFPSGTYFFPFIFVEMMSSFIFGLLFYRAKLNVPRIFFARFSVTVICNIIINPVIMYFYYKFYFDIFEKTYAVISLPRVIKNAAMFPLEAVLLVYFIGLMQPVLFKLRLLRNDGDRFIAKLTKKNIIILALLTVIAAIIVVLYYFVYLKNK